MLFKCPDCEQAVTRLSRLKSHAVAKHNLVEDSREMEKFIKKCSKLNKRGVRFTTLGNIVDKLGRLGQSDTAIQACRQALQENGIFVKNNETKQQQQQQEDLITTPRRPLRQKRGCIAKAGLAYSFEKIGRVATLFQTLDSQSTGRSPRSAKAAAHMIHRFIQWAKTEKPGLQDVAILCNLDLPGQFNKILLKTFKPYTVKNHTTALCNLLDAVLWNVEFRIQLNISANMKKKIAAAKQVWENLKTRNERCADRKSVV